MMIETLVGKTIVFLNNIQLAHWQTRSYSEHEGLGEYYTKLNALNDRLVETYQGNSNTRIHIDMNQYEDQLSILEDMAEATSQIQYHLTLK